MKMQSLSRFIAYILRHNPSAGGISLDAHGFADVAELLVGITKTGRQIDFGVLCDIVENDEKGRFAFNEDKTKIRANQGHSFAVDVEMTESVPPDILYHGTAEKYLESIKKSGLVKKSRNFVHLSKDRETAVKVGQRHGNPVVLVIDAKQMAKNGFKFYLSSNGVWQTDSVPKEYIVNLNEEIMKLGFSVHIVNPKLCSRLSIEVEVVQNLDGEKSAVPFVLVYHDKSRSLKKCSLIRLDKAEYYDVYGKTQRLSVKSKVEFIQVMITQIVSLRAEKQPLTGYETAVSVWIDTYEQNGDKFTFDDSGNLVMPNYSQLKTARVESNISKE